MDSRYGNGELGFVRETVLESALLAILDSAITATGAQFGNIQVRIPKTNALRIAVQRGFGRSFLEFFAVVRNEELCSCEAAFARVRQVVVKDVRVSRVFSDQTPDMLLASGVEACQSTPIVVTGYGVAGMLNTHFHRRRYPSRRQLSQVNALVKRAAALLQPAHRSSDTSNVARVIDELRDASVKTRTIRARNKQSA